MSETVTGGVAVGAVGACAAVVGMVAKAPYRAAAWLSQQAANEVDRLERELAAPPTHATTAEARAAFEQVFERVKALAAKLPALHAQADAVAGLLAMRRTPLGAFLTEAQRSALLQSPPVAAPSLRALVDEAAGRLTQANARTVARSIIEVAKQEGFTSTRLQRHTGGGQILVMTDPQGRALVATVAASEQGAQTTLDLTGFGDGSCHGVMDRVLRGLAERNIRLDRVRRRAHYRREGGLQTVAFKAPQPVKATGRRVSQDDEQRAATRRRQALLNTTLKNRR